MKPQSAELFSVVGMKKAHVLAQVAEVERGKIVKAEILIGRRKYIVTATKQSVAITHKRTGIKLLAMDWKSFINWHLIIGGGA